MRLTLLPVLCTWTVRLFAQTFTAAPNQPVPDDGQFYTFTITVSGLPNVIDPNFGLERICMNYAHTWDADVQMWLQAPDGTQVTLSTDNGGEGDNFANTCFTDNAYLSIEQGGPPYTGNYRPETPLMAVNNGQNPNGTWTLIFYDTYWFADSGWLYEWSLTFTDELVNPEPDPFYFETSNLPLVYINTNGQNIPDEPGVSAWLQVIDNGIGQINHITDPYTYEGLIDIELRGQSTLGFPKKSFSLEMRDNLNNDLDTTMLGLPSEEDWIFYAPYSEKSLMQNALSMDLGRAIGGYHSRVRYFELFLNGVYQGVYLLMERIKQDKNRVDLAKMTVNDISGTQLTGGYIFRLDWGNATGWYSQFPTPNDPNSFPYYQFIYPRPEVLQPQQFQYLKAYVDSFEFAVNNPTFSFAGKRYDEWIDLPSFVDNFIMNELSDNVDAYRLSSYYYKDKNGKLIAGPLWDFNLSFGNANYCDGENPANWQYQGCGTWGPSWWPRFMQDTVFTNLLKCRWDYLRTNVLSNESLNARIDSMAQLLAESAPRNFDRWPVLGVYVWPNPWPYPNSFDEAVLQLKTWIANRLNWMDAYITGSPLCVPYVVNQSPHTEWFEGNESPPQCWTVIDADGDGNNWLNGTPVLGFNSDHCAYSNSFNQGQIQLNPDNYLVTPQLTPLNGEHLTFYVSTASGQSSETFQVLLSTTGNEVNDFTTVLWSETLSTAQWQYRAADLSPWWGQNIYLAFRHFNSQGNLMLKLDEVRYPSWTNPSPDCLVAITEDTMPQVQVYPNPADNILWVDAGSVITGRAFLSDATGAVVLREPFSTNRFVLHTEELAPGYYTLCIETKDGGQVFRKVVIN